MNANKGPGPDTPEGGVEQVCATPHIYYLAPLRAVFVRAFDFLGVAFRIASNYGRDE